MHVGTEALPLFQPLPDVAPVRHPSRETSVQAAAGIRDLTQRHEAVWRVLRAIGPATDCELEAAYDRFENETWWSPQTAQSQRSRRALLAHPHYGLVVTDGSKRPTPNGNQATVFAAVDADRAETLFERMKR